MSKMVNNRKNGIALAISIVFFFTLPASAEQVYKCTNADGSVRFSDTACETAKSEVVDVVVNDSMDSSDIRSKMQAREAAIKKKELEAETKPAEKSSAKDKSSESTSPASGSTSMTCNAARRMLSFYDDGRLDTLNETLKAKADVEAACGEKVITKKEIAAKEKEQRDMQPIIVRPQPRHHRRQNCYDNNCRDDERDDYQHNDHHDNHASHEPRHTSSNTSGDSGKGLLNNAEPDDGLLR